MSGGRITGRPWSDDDDRQLRRLWASGRTAKYVGLELSRSVDSVRHRVERLGLVYDPATRNRCVWTPEADAKLAVHWADLTITAENIGKIFGTTCEAIKTRAKTIGLPRRGAHVALLRRLGAPKRSEGILEAAAKDDAERTLRHAQVCLAHGGFPVAVVLGGQTVHVYPNRRAA